MSTASGEMSVGHWARAVSSLAALLPSAMPIKPPKALSVTASIRNWRMMSRRWPDGHADPNLARAFVTSQHDVHDANATDDQRHTGNEGHRIVIVRAWLSPTRQFSNWLRTLEVVVAPASIWWRWRRDSHLLFNNGQYLQVGRLDVECGAGRFVCHQTFDRRCVKAR